MLLGAYRGRLPEDLSIKIFRESGFDARFQAVQVCNVFSDVIRSGRNRGAFDVEGGSLAAGEDHTVICTAEGRVLTFGYRASGQLGHGGNANEMMPRMVEGLADVKVAQVAAGYGHTVICTTEGRVWTFGLTSGLGNTVDSATVVTLMRWFLEWSRVWWV